MLRDRIEDQKVSKFQSLLVSWFLGFLVSWFLGFLVSKVQSFKVPKIQRFEDPKISFPYYQAKFSRSDSTDLWDCSGPAFWNIFEMFDFQHF